MRYATRSGLAWAGTRVGIALNGDPVPRRLRGRWNGVGSNNDQETPPNGIFRDFAAFGDEIGDVIPRARVLNMQDRIGLRSEEVED